jgi:hypothetical protein
MDRLASLFEQLSIPEVARLLRRTGFSAAAMGIVALGIAVLVSHPLVGLGAAAGLALGLVNIRLVTRSVVRLTEHPVDRPRRVLAGRSIGRLGMTTVVVLGFCVASISLGLGAFAGLSLFYLVFIVNVAMALLHPSNPRLPA